MAEGVSHLEEGVVAARCELAGKLDVAVQPAPGRDKTEAGEKTCLMAPSTVLWPRLPEWDLSRGGTLPTHGTLTPRSPPQC